MRREIAATVLGLFVLAGSGCSGKDEDTTKATIDPASSVSETSEGIDESMYQERFSMWSAQRTSYMLEEGAQAERTPGSGTDSEGNDYESYYVNAGDGEYRSIEVVFDINTNNEKHYEFYDVADDLMYLMVTAVSTSTDGNLSMEMHQYAIVGGADVYEADTDTDGQTVYTLLGENEAPTALRIFDEVISAYAG